MYVLYILDTCHTSGFIHCKFYNCDYSLKGGGTGEVVLMYSV